MSASPNSREIGSAKRSQRARQPIARSSGPADGPHTPCVALGGTTHVRALRVAARPLGGRRRRSSAVSEATSLTATGTPRGTSLLSVHRLVRASLQRAVGLFS